MVDETTIIAAMYCPFQLPQPGQSKDFQLCAVTKQRSRLFDATLNALINASMNGPESLQCGGFTFVQRSLTFSKLTNTPLIYSISYFNFRGWELCLRG